MEVSTNKLAPVPDEVASIIEPPKPVLVEREVCKDVRGCELLKGGVCPTCKIDYVWE